MKNIFEEKSPQEIEAMVFEYIVKNNPDKEFFTKEEIPDNKNTRYYSGSGDYNYRIKIDGNIHPCKLIMLVGLSPNYEVNLKRVYDTQISCWRYCSYKNDNTLVFGDVDSCWAADGF